VPWPRVAWAWHRACGPLEGQSNGVALYAQWTAARPGDALDAEKTVLGRDAACQVVIPAMAVSRRHAQILRVNGEYFIANMENRSSFFVNNQAVDRSPMQLKDNDQIQICDFRCIFHDDRI
jgi:pSer/pThr/pTyr-binding forkhead associated (FHA) protein